MTFPTFCRIEYHRDGRWLHGHEGINLMDPETYLTKAAERGTRARITLPDGKVIQRWCPFCDEQHPEPYVAEECLI